MTKIMVQVVGMSTHIGLVEANGHERFRKSLEGSPIWRLLRQVPGPLTYSSGGKGRSVGVFERPMNWRSVLLCQRFLFEPKHFSETLQALKCLAFERIPPRSNRC